MTAEGRLAALAAGRLGLFTLDDARTVGVSAEQLEGYVARGVHERLVRGVFAVAGMPWTWERNAQAALLATGPAAWLSHRAAAHHLGFDGFGECPVEVTVPRGRLPGSRLAVVHTTTQLHSLDFIRVGRFPVTSASRTIIDLAAVGATADEQSAAIGSAIRDGRTSVAFLRKRLTSLRGPGRHGVVLLDAVLRGPIAHSHLERLFLKLIAAAGLEMPETQVIFDGETVVRVDFYWPRARLVVEVMGHRFHITKEQLQRDAQRRGELQEVDIRVLEFTTDDVARRPEWCITRIRRNLVARSAV
jgi:predicted transcriptional regulator of viral defense system